MHGVITGFGSLVMQLYSEHKAKQCRIKTLRALLLGRRYDWRSIKILAFSIGQRRRTTRGLLLEIGARRSEGEKEMWTLKKV
jgi:hypothetical protein